MSASFEADNTNTIGGPAAIDETDRLIVVGIGASAGGLEALERLFAHMPVDSGMAFVVIQHLSPDFRSVMDELLARHTTIPIMRVENGMAVAANAVYLMPPRTEMIISGGKLLLTDKEPSSSLSLPIDLFFRSLAEDKGSRAVGIVLSGTGSDGSRGARAIHEAGGLVIAQSEETSKFDGMPRSAVETGMVDFILSPEEIPQTLVKFSRQSAGVDSAPDERGATTADHLNAVFQLLRKSYGIDFTHYKPNMVSRRIERRLTFNRSLDLAGYVRQLETDPGELNALYKDLLIGVTRFFRDPAAFERLEKEVLPSLISRVPENQEIRVWVAGCATGEEAYSLAISMREQLRLLNRENPLKVFATDVHRESLEFAGAGRFSEASVAGISPARLERYFVKQGSNYQVTPELRATVVFAPHNVIRDAPFTKLDLVSCRNLLIYLQPAAQRKALSLFHFGLKPQGVLLLGPSESPGELSDEYEVLDPHWKVYRKRRDVRLVNDLAINASPYVPPTQLIRSPLRSIAQADSDWPRIAELLLNEAMPPSILLDEQHRVLHTFGGAGKYLTIRDGRHSTDVLAMVSGELKLGIGGVLQRAAGERRSVTFGPVRRGEGAGGEWLSVSARPILPDHSRTLLVFHPQPDPEPTGEPRAERSAETSGETSSQSHQELLENELRYTRENLQATVEELETANEELQAANEELVASNEELQSTNEELHSVNEELYTVNAEYQRKIVELTELTDDIENLLRTTEVGVIFLDRELRIRRFTPPITRLFPLQQQDVGRRLDEFSNAIKYDRLLQTAEGVLSNGTRQELEVEDEQGTFYLLRVLPYLTRTGIEGVVLTLVDVSTLKRAEKESRDAVERRDRFLAMLSHELRNPLGAIVNARKVIERAAGDPQRVAQGCGVIQRQAAQMARLLDDLLDVARVTQGKIRTADETVDLTRVAAGVLEIIEPMAAARRQHLEVSIVPGPLWVRGDGLRLQQVQVNLLANSVKYTPPSGTIRFVIRQEGNEAVIQVQDSGLGISAEMLPHVFDLFVQCHDTVDRADGGIGVGLTLVRHLVDLHGGTVEARSDGPGRGSEFIVRLPTTAPPPVSSAGESGANGSTAPRRLAIVEDNSDSREMLHSLLRMDGYEVFAARDGLEGVELIVRHRPEAALVDIGLPGIDGYEVARRVRAALGDQILLIALTGYGREEDRRAVLSAGFDDHLVKPLDPDDLIRVLSDRRG